MNDDRFDEGYESARRFYRTRMSSELGIISEAARAWQNPNQERGRHAIKRLWPELAKSLDALVEKERQMRAKRT